MTDSPAQLFKKSLNKPRLRSLFEEYMSERSAMGIDGISLPRFSRQLDQELDVIIRKVSLGTYKFTTYREKLLLKGRDKLPRVISIPTIRDKLVLKFLSELLIEIYPDHRASIPHGLVKRIHEISSTAGSEMVFLRLDIQDFYPTVDHTILMRTIKRSIRKKEFISLLEEAISTPTGSKGRGANTTGVPQGLSISNTLASVYMGDIDNQMNARTDLHYFRYVDDILIIAPRKTAESVAEELPKHIKRKRRLKCHELQTDGKSKISSVSDGIDYLGYNFSGKSLRIRTSSYKKAFSALIKFFTSMKYNRNKTAAIWRLNIRISGCIYGGKRIGWMFYFAQTKDLKQLRRLDYFVGQNCAKHLNVSDRAKVKTFIKAYHEIRFKFDRSTYFPNFDNFDTDQKRAALKSLSSRRRAAAIDALSEDELDERFRIAITREVSELERDMMDAIS